METVLSFLRQVQNNNNREWFHAHKEEYQTALEAANQIGQKFMELVQSIDTTITGITLKDCTYRLYRDTRFSSDKTPYKTHIGTYVAKGGKKSGLAGYYLHIENNNSFITGGLWSPEKEPLSKIRQDMVNNTESWEEILSDKNVVKFFGGFEEMEALKIPPRGIPKDFQHMQWVKQKHFLFTHRLENKVITKPDFLSTLEDYIITAKPLVQHINSVI